MDSQISIGVYSTTALFYINKMNGVRFGKLEKLAGNIWQWAEARRIILLASYIPLENNGAADRLSQMAIFETDWDSNDLYYQLAVNYFPELISLLLRAMLSVRILFHENERETLYMIMPSSFLSDLYFYAFAHFFLILKTFFKVE